MNLSCITRVSEPNKLDTANLGTLCKVTGKDSTIFYIQMSADSENPRWELLDVIQENEALLKALEISKVR